MLSVEKQRCHRTRWRSPRWCTVAPEAVHTATCDASLHNLTLSRVQVGIALGVVVPPDKGWRWPPRAPPSRPPQPVTAPGVAVHDHKGVRARGAATQARLRLLFFTFFHHLCKCANTPSVSLSRASVLAFSQTFFKGYSLLTDCALCLKCNASISTPSGTR